jgi:carbon monoxide dehydrogenase subunit G
VIEFTGHLDVAHPPRIVFEQLADMAKLSRWNPNVTASQRTSGDRFAVGSTYLSTIRRGPLRMVARSTLTAVEPGRSVTYEGSISGMWSVDSLGFEPNGAGTRITFKNHTQPPTWMRPFGPILNAAFQPQACKAVDGARRYLEHLPREG